MSHHYNAITKVLYQGANQEALQSATEERGYHSLEWCTFLQAKEMGKKVKKGSHGVSLMRFIEGVANIKKEGKVEKEYKSGLRYFTVFNTEQLEDAKVPELVEESN